MTETGHVTYESNNWRLDENVVGDYSLKMQFLVLRCSKVGTRPLPYAAAKVLVAALQKEKRKHLGERLVSFSLEGSSFPRAGTKPTLHTFKSP